MGLGPNEQRLLTQIEQALRGADPKLAGKLTIFNRLTSREEMPLWERLLPRPSKLVRFAPMAMAVFVLCMLAVSVTVLSRIGPPAGTADAACGIAWVQGCHAAGASPQNAHGTVNVRR
jgi:hypothetical protein